MSSTSSTSPLIAGFTGGVVATTLLLPLDVVKVRLQVSEASDRHHRHRFGSVKVLRGIIRHEGLAGIYQGWTPAVIGSAVSWGGYFYFYEAFKRRLVDYKLGSTQGTATREDASRVLNSVDNFCLACGAGAVMVFMTNPVWLVKTRLQLQMKKAQKMHNIEPYNGMIDAFRTIIRDEGPLAIYKGTGPALLLTSHGGVQFVVYEYLRKHFHYSRVTKQHSKNRNVWERLELSSGYLCMGAVAKMAASLATYPLQVIKARMQQRTATIDLTAEGDVKAVTRNYSGILDTTQRIWKQEGISGFFKGIIPNTIRVAPSAAVTFVVYETVMDRLLT